MHPDSQSAAGSPPSYREQLRRLARAMAANRHEDVGGDLVASDPLARVEMFVHGNLDKRFEKLQRQLGSVAAAFDHFDDLIESYIRETPLAAYDTGASDGERMLVWLERTRPLTREQQDHVACQRARHAVEALARRERLAHVRFQERLSLAERLLAELDANADLRVELNPIHAWARFQTASLLDEDATPPADVVLFPVGGDVSTAVLEPRGRELVDELAVREPMTLAQWSVLSRDADRDELLDVTRDLVEMGLAALI